MNHSAAEQAPALLFRLLDPRTPRLPAPTLSNDHWQVLLAFARHCHLGSYLSHRLQSDVSWPELPAGVRLALRKSYLEQGARNLQLLEEFDRVVALLQSEGIPVLALKGVHLAKAFYGNIALREMQDLDLLVPRRQGVAAGALLMARGYRPHGPEEEPGSRMERCHHLSLVSPKGIAVELHWHLFPPSLGLPVPVDQLWTRARAITPRTREVLSLSDEDLLLHLCLHVCNQHLFEHGGAKFCCDVALMIARLEGDLDWDVVVERARAWRCQRGVLLALTVAREVAGAGVPGETLEALGAGEESERLAALAAAQLFAQSEAVTEGLVSVWRQETARGKAAALFRRIFLPRGAMAGMYPVGDGRWRLCWYYLVRIADLTRRHLGTVRGLYRNEPALVGLAERKSRVMDWLAGDEVGGG